MESLQHLSVEHVAVSRVSGVVVAGSVVAGVSLVAALLFSFAGNNCFFDDIHRRRHSVGHVGHVGAVAAALQSAGGGPRQSLPRDTVAPI